MTTSLYLPLLFFCRYLTILRGYEMCAFILEHCVKSLPVAEIRTIAAEKFNLVWDIRSPR